ncbi:hypothetical protein [Streptomyces goshikiensis]|uniref:hypothetical protein n=1 Tax=Streptomyces goshikiensis TaxID=1942 RepID=UPI003674984D
MRTLTVPYNSVGDSLPIRGSGLWLRLDVHTMVEITLDAGHSLTYALDLEVRPRAGTIEVIG